MAVAITTIDNPYNPITDFDNWYRFDEESGYHTCAYLARLTNNSDLLTDQEESDDIESAIDEIVQNDFLGVYKKIKL